MTLCLSSHEQRTVANAIRVLASPVVTATGWMEDALRVTSAVGNGTSVCVVPPALAGRPDGFHLDSPTLPANVLKDYDRYFPYLVETGAFERSVRQRVVSRRMAYGDRYDEIIRSEYTHDFLRPVRSFDAITMTVPLVARPRTHRDVVQLAFVSHEPYRPYGDRHLDLARLLHPALEAGIATLQHVRKVRGRLRASIDATGAACWVADRDGVICPRTPALESMLAQEPDRGRLLEVADALARSFWSVAPVAQTRFVGRAATYRLSVTEVRDAAEPFCVVRVERVLEAAPLDPACLGLTPRQYQVAVLLADRRTNKEIATALALSAHTARHHVEAVLATLGVRRKEVARALRRPSSL